MMPALPTPITLFLSYLSLAWPFLLLGVVISSALMAFTDEHRWVARFPRNRLLGSLVGSGLGLLLPVGQLGCLPIVRRFLIQGAPLPLVISFGLAAPTINLVTIYLMFGPLASQPRLIFLRLLLTWFLAIVIALVFSTYREATPATPEAVPLSKIPLLYAGSLVAKARVTDPLQRSGNLVYESSFDPVHRWDWSLKWRLFLDNTSQELREWGGVLVVMTALAAGIQSILPQAHWIDWATTPVRQILVMMIWAVCFPFGSIFNAAFVVPLLEQFWSGALLAFLILGSILNLQTLGLGLIAFHWRPLLYLGLLVMQLTFIFALAVNLSL